MQTLSRLRRHTLLVLATALTLVGTAAFAGQNALTTIVSDDKDAELKITATVGQHVRVETDPYWEDTDRKKKGTPADAPKTVHAALQWQNKSGDWATLAERDVPINGQAVLEGDLTEGAANTPYRLYFTIASMPEGHNLVIAMALDVTDKAQTEE